MKFYNNYEYTPFMAIGVNISPNYGENADEAYIK
jgi:hypothetical protein